MNNKKIMSEDFDESKQKNQSIVNQDKKTKKKSNAQKAIPILIIAVVALLVILTCVLISYYQVYKANKQTANILEGVYASSYYSMVDNVNNLSVDVAKYSSLTTKQSKLETMNDMMQDCNYILAGLSTLPISRDNVLSATKFFNQISGLCEAYSVVLNKGEDLSVEQELLFDEISIVLDKIKANLNLQNMSTYSSNFNFVNAGIFDDTGMNTLSETMGDMTDESVEYPAMIFDGPFSTALETKEVKGLPQNEISENDAYNYLRNTVYANRDDVAINYSGDTNGDISTFNYDVVIGQKRFMAQVSKRGRLLMTISGYAEQADPIISKNQAIELAKTFANNIGFESMQEVWLEVHDNVAYVNLAPVISDVIYYPDLVKVKVDLTSQEIIGFEALNYALNHVERTPEFNVDIDKAESLLGFDYNVLKVEKTVIRLDSGKEISAYEFMVERMDGMYFYYINANTCEIAKIMKLVTVEGVEKLI